MNPFRRSRELERELGLDTKEVDGYVPSSAKAPEWQRFAPLSPDDLDVSEQDAQFLADLAAGITQDAPTKPRRLALAPAPGHAVTPSASQDDLHVFRELAQADRAETVLTNIRVPDVELGDLLDDLHTMRAALRHRKAA